MRFPGLAPYSLVLGAACIGLTGCNNSTMATNPSSPTNPGSSGNPGSPGNPTSPTSPSSPPANVAFVYVSSQPTTSMPDTQTFAYAADASGQLTPVSGSPFTLGVSPGLGMMAANKAYVVVDSSTGSNINTYTIGSNGALTLGPQFDAAPINSQIASEVASQEQSRIAITCIMAADAFDRNGQSLYAEVSCTDGSNNYTRVASFAVDASKGTLSYLGNAFTGANGNYPLLTFLGNDAYAYQVYPTGCSTILGGGVSSFSRSSNGLLNSIHTVITGPPKPPGATGGAGPFGYVIGQAAADATNHVAFIEDPCFFLGGASRPIQLATYTADPDGSLTTTDTYTTMPSTPIHPLGLSMSPSGTFLAVGGSGGLQIFRFNGASPITSYTDVLTTDTIGPMLWDNNNHLFALAPFQGGPGNTSGPGKLHVFAVTDSGANEAPGSPYTIQNPRFLAVSIQGSK